MINDFNSGTEGWTDWNILSMNGRPNHVGNFCFAPIHADTRTGSSSIQFVLLHRPFLEVHPSGAKRISRHRAAACCSPRLSSTKMVAWRSWS